MGQELVRETGDALNPIQWSRDLFKEHLKLFSLKGMMGKKGTGASIIIDTTLQANAGDTVRYEFIPQALNTTTDALRGQDVTILGNESSLTEFSLDIVIDEVSFALRKRGKMTDQRSLVNFREEHTRQLARNFAQFNEDVNIDALTGTVDGVPATSTTDVVNSDGGVGRIIQADGTNDSTELADTASDDTSLAASISDNDTMSPRLIEDAVIMARTSGKFKMQPIRVGPNNEEFFMLLVSLRAARDLRFHEDWLNHAYSIIERGIGDDPIAVGALGVWDNVIVKPSERIVTGNITVGGTFARNLLIGGDASILAWAQTTQYTEELIDHGRTLSSAASEIRGETKVTFDNVDMGVAQIITASN